MARLFGDKLHYNQNEKLAMYGVTHVMAVDGFSRKIVGMISIPTKNPILIYNALTRPLLLSDGLWQQVRLDHGPEFVLVVAAQQHLSNHRQWQDRHPVLQSTSCQNHCVKRMWPEVNHRVNYPVNRVLIEMEARDEIDMTNNTIKYCVSWTTINVIMKPTQTFVKAWNAHRRGGSVLTEERVFGRDPLERNTELQPLRERDFRFCMEAVFQNIVHNDGALFREAIHFFIHLTLFFSVIMMLDCPGTGTKQSPYIISFDV